MALLSTGEWYQITWLPTTNAAWAAMSPIPAIPSGLIDAIVNGTSVMIYVTDSASGSFVFEGGSAIGFDDTLIDVSSGILTQNVWTTNDSVSYIYGLTGASTVYYYDSPNGTLRSFGAGATGAMKAFLP